MYKVKNITKGKLLLFDINVKLDAGEVIDLDARMPREQADASVNLRIALDEKNQLAAVLHKDVFHSAPSYDPAMFLEMERRIREQIVQQMQPQASPAPQVLQASQNTEMAQLTAQLSQLISKIGNGQTVTQSTSGSIEEYAPDDDKLLEVHAKALKRMTQGSSGHIEAKETTSQSQVSGRASELDDLLK